MRKLKILWPNHNIKQYHTVEYLGCHLDSNLVGESTSSLRSTPSLKHRCDASGKNRSSHPEVFLGKGALKMCSKFTVKHPCRCVISIKLPCNFIEITLRNGCSPVHLLHISWTPFPKNISGWLLLKKWIGSQFLKG